MNKKLFAVASILVLITVTSCCEWTGSATFDIYNHSSYQVTNLFMPGMTREDSIDVLEPGTSYTLINEWPCHDRWYVEIYFTKNGLEHGALFLEQFTVDTTPDRFKLPKRVFDGDRVTVRIYNDRWEW